ncbi:MAG: hypothetical protein H0V73_05795 [Chloroflexi bacterium]|nr:hypothetical protein [Chloroflexota bacterium]
MKDRTRTYARGLALAGTVSLVAAGCGGGGDDATKPTKVAVNVTESGKQATIEVPKEVEGGLVELSLDNSAGKAPHAGQLILLNDGHTAQEAIAIVGSEKPQPIPSWLRAEGGVGSTAPGESNAATVKLPEGHYAVIDDAGMGGPPPFTEFDVKGDNGGDLPETDASVTAAETDGTPEYEWKVDGLKTGENTFTFNSEGDNALHHIVAAPIKGDATLDQIKTELESDGPPKSIDFENSVDASVIDGGESQVVKFNLQAGRYAFVCFLPDRDKPDEPHFTEGLLKDFTIGG